MEKGEGIEVRKGAINKGGKEEMAVGGESRGLEEYGRDILWEDQG